MPVGLYQIQTNAMPHTILRNSTQTSSFGGRIVNLIGLSDLKNGVKELSIGEYKKGCKSLLKATVKASITGSVIYGTYKLVDYALKQPYQQTLETDKCTKSKNGKKWGLTCEEYENDAELKEFINRPEIYRAKNFLGEKLELKRNIFGQLLIPMNKGYEKWSNVKAITDVGSLIATQNGYAPHGSSFSVLPNIAKLKPGFYAEINTIDNGYFNWMWNKVPPSHNWVRLREVTTDTVTTHSIGFYPVEKGGFKTLLAQTFSSTKGQVVSADLVEWTINPSSDITQTRFPASKEQFKEIKDLMLADLGEYHTLNSLGAMSCKGFAEKVLNILKVDLTGLSIFPTGLASNLASQYPKSTFTGSNVLPLSIIGGLTKRR